MKKNGNFSVVQWLRLYAFTARVQFTPWSGNCDPATHTRNTVACPRGAATMSFPWVTKLWCHRLVIKTIT